MQAHRITASWEQVPAETATAVSLALPDFAGAVNAELVRFAGPQVSSVVASPAAHSISFVQGGRGRIAWHVGGRTREAAIAKGGYSIVPSSADDNLFVVDGALESLHLGIDPGFLASVVERELDRSTSGLELRPDVRRREPAVLAFGTALANELRNPGIGSPLYVDALVIGLAVQLAREHSNLTVGEAPRVRPLSAHDLQTAMDYIRDNLATDVRLPAIASVVGLSPHHFAKSFKAATGQAPHAYVIEQRVASARRMLADDEASIADIAYRVGFSSQSHLTTTFRRICGVTPQEYRRRSGACAKSQHGARDRVA